MTTPDNLRLFRQWLLSLLLGSACYALSQGIVHFSDWCYLAASTAVAAGVSALLIPLNKHLLNNLTACGPQWSVPGRWAWLLAGTLGLFGLATLLTWPLLSWPGPGGVWPWGAAALIATVLMNRNLLLSPVERPQRPK